MKRKMLKAAEPGRTTEHAAHAMEVEAEAKSRCKHKAAEEDED